MKSYKGFKTTKKHNYSPLEDFHPCFVWLTETLTLLEILDRSQSQSPPQGTSHEGSANWLLPLLKYRTGRHLTENQEKETPDHLDSGQCWELVVIEGPEPTQPVSHLTGLAEFDTIVNIFHKIHYCSLRIMFSFFFLLMVSQSVCREVRHEVDILLVPNWCCGGYFHGSWVFQSNLMIK